MSKRPTIDLMALTAEHAAPMPESVQRTSSPSPGTATPLPKSITRQVKITTVNLEALAFKVSPAFRKRFKQCAVNADLKLNELLFAALDAWEEKQGIKK